MNDDKHTIFYTKARNIKPHLGCELFLDVTAKVSMLIILVFHLFSRSGNQTRI